MMDPMVRSIWFTQVSEMQSLPTVAGTSAPMAAAVAAFPAVGVLCALALARDRKVRGDFGFVVATAALLVAVAVMLAMVRAYSYAVWLAIPMAAAAALRLGSALRLATLAGRTLVALMLTPTVTSAVALAAVGAMTRQDTGPENSRVTEGCLRSENDADGLPRVRFRIGSNELRQRVHRSPSIGSSTKNMTRISLPPDGALVLRNMGRVLPMK
jgi:hypothetical protein